MSILFISLSSCKKSIKVEVSESDRSRFLILPSITTQAFSFLQRFRVDFCSSVCLQDDVFTSARRDSRISSRAALVFVFLTAAVYLCLIGSWGGAKEFHNPPFIPEVLPRSAHRSQTLISQTNLTLLLFLWKHAGRRSSFSDDIPPTQSAVFTVPELLKQVSSKALLPIDEPFYTASD